MQLSIDRKDLDKLIVIGDRLLIQPTRANDRTSSGLYLPPGVEEKEQTRSGYVLKVGPGYPIPAIPDTDEPWKRSDEQVRYVPLQPREGDLAVYLRNASHEIEFGGEKFVIVGQSGVLMVVRDEALFD